MTNRELEEIKELGRELKKIYPDVEFMAGTLGYAKNHEDRQKLMEFIKTEEDVTSSDVLLYALALHQERQKKEKK